MPKNVEIKARLPDAATTRGLVERLATGPAVVLEQQDTFFGCPRGRLKLRECPGAPAELIFYERSDVVAPRESDYEIVRASDAAALRHLLDRSLGTTRVVKKRRLLFHVGQTRIHLDTVVGLGEFIELEVVLQSGQTAATGREIAAGLMHALGIRPDDLVSGAYADLLPD